PAGGRGRQHQRPATGPPLLDDTPSRIARAGGRDDGTIRCRRSRSLFPTSRIFDKRIQPLASRGTTGRGDRCRGDTATVVAYQRRILMKLSPSVPLALALAVGLGGGAMAQTSAT